MEHSNDTIVEYFNEYFLQNYWKVQYIKEKKIW